MQALYGVLNASQKQRTENLWQIVSQQTKNSIKLLILILLNT